MGYYIDLEKITIDDYKARLQSAYLPPSRLILKEKLDERLGYFKIIGINNVKGLIQLLKKKDKFAELSKVDCLQGDYLTILLRELNSTLPKPNKIADFTAIAKDTVIKASKTDPVDLHTRINKLNKEKSIYKGQIGLNDMKIFLNAAKEIPLEIEY